MLEESGQSKDDQGPSHHGAEYRQADDVKERHHIVEVKKGGEESAKKLKVVEVKL